jgi:DtxR family Mn-dependent transcriptional regulator
MPPGYTTSSREKLSPSLEDYLEAVFDLGPPARVSSIAGRLKVAKASVTQAVQRLIEKGLVESARYGRVSLTARGLKLAREVRNRHDTLVTFLRDVLGVPDAVADRDACVLEHGLSDETAELLADYTSSVVRRRKNRRRTASKRVPKKATRNA